MIQRRRPETLSTSVDKILHQSSSLPPSPPRCFEEQPRPWEKKEDVMFTQRKHSAEDGSHSSVPYEILNPDPVHPLY